VLFYVSLGNGTEMSMPQMIATVDCLLFHLYTEGVLPNRWYNFMKKGKAYFFGKMLLQGHGNHY